MRSMGAQEAANEIRERVMLDRSSRASPEDQHRLKFVKDVIDHLGLEQSAENVLHIGAVLREQGIAIHEGNEYPKWVVRKYDNTQHLVNDEHEADEIINAEPPPPVEPAPRVVERPVQALDIDLKDKVPHMVKSDAEKRAEELARQQIDGDGTRQPSDLTRQVPREPAKAPEKPADEVVSTDDDTFEADPVHDQKAPEPKPTVADEDHE